jgi:hypothetical protein
MSSDRNPPLAASLITAVPSVAESLASLMNDSPRTLQGDSHVQR